MAGTLKLGSSYSSFSDLEAAIDAYERCKFVNYYKRSSRSIEAHKKRCLSMFNHGCCYVTVSVTVALFGSDQSECHYHCQSLSDSPVFKGINPNPARKLN